MTKPEPCVVIDRTHLGRRASGLERITRDLFSDERLAPLNVRGTAMGSGRLATLARQLVLNPFDALRHPQSVWIFSGFPPSPLFGRFADRSILYVHDLFLIERSVDLNRAGRLYLAPNFRSALTSFRWFLANSSATLERLRPYINAEANVTLYRPPASDVLGLATLRHGSPNSPRRRARIGMIGTIEPRKNYAAAMAIRSALATRVAVPVELHVVGRNGWGADIEALGRAPGVHVHGFVDDAHLVDHVATWDLFLSTSHDEGLGLPLLEVQHAGLPIVAPDKPVFREVLGTSGLFIDTATPDSAADQMAALLTDPGSQSHYIDAARGNLERWNELAASDHATIIKLLTARLLYVRKG